MPTEIPKIEGAGDALREIREDADWSQKRLAAALGWHYTRLSKYENNRLALSQDVIEAIADKLDISPALVVLRCLQARYPALSDKRTKAGRLIEDTIEEVSKR